MKFYTHFKYFFLIILDFFQKSKSHQFNKSTIKSYVFGGKEHEYNIILMINSHFYAFHQYILQSGF